MCHPPLGEEHPARIHVPSNSESSSPRGVLAVFNHRIFGYGFLFDNGSSSVAGDTGDSSRHP